jgi:hypothetical protein
VPTVRDCIISANEDVQCFSRKAPRKMPFGGPMRQWKGAARMKLEKDYIVSVFIMFYCAFAQIFVLQLK